MYKVLQSVAENNKTGTHKESSVTRPYVCLSCGSMLSKDESNIKKNHEISTEVIQSQTFTEASVGGRVKDPEAKKAIAKEMGDLGSAPLMDLETGAFKAKKVKKEKSAEEAAMCDLKAYEKKFLDLYPNNQS